MGTREAAITCREFVNGNGRLAIDRDDFPVPPELLGRDLSLAPSEHIGGIRAELICRDDAVRLGRCYYQNPLRIMLPIEECPGGPVLLLLMNSTAGLLDGDAQLVSLDVGPGARAFVTNQSAGRVHPCPLWHASARYHLKIASGAVVCMLPGPTIPFAGSRFVQMTEIHLEEGAAVVWGDLILPGRTSYHRAPERFAFDRLIQGLSVWRQGRLIHHERFAWQGPWNDQERAWHMDGHEAAATLFLSGPLDPDIIGEIPGGVVATMTTAAGDTCIRILGRDPEPLILATARIALTAAARFDGLTRPWFLGSNRLAPTHWFTAPSDMEAHFPSDDEAS